MDIVTLQNVKKYFVIGGQVKALDGISLSVEKGGPLWGLPVLERQRF